MSFIFWPQKGERQLSPEQIALKRKYAAMMMGNAGPRSAQTAGEGIGNALNSIGLGIAANVMNRRANSAEQEGMAGANSLRDRIIAALTGAQQFPAAPAESGAAPGLVSAPDGSFPADDGTGLPSAATGGNMSGYQNAIAAIESAGSGDYAAVGPRHSKLGRALGRYQIMESNIGPWSQAALGRKVTPDEFMSSPQIQDAIFNHRFGQYVNQFGPEGAAQAWFAGPGGVGKMGRRDSLGTSVAAYTDKFRRALGSNAPAVSDVNAIAGNVQPASAPGHQGPLGIDANYSPGAPAYTTEAGPRVVQTLLNPQPMGGSATGGAPAASQPQPSTAGPLPLLDDVFDARFGSPPANPPPPVESPGMQALAQPGGEQQDPAAMRWLFNQEPQAGASMGSAPGVGSQPPAPVPALSAHNVDPTLPMAGAVGNNTPPPSGNVPMELLVEALSNQFLPPEVKAFAAAQLQQQMQERDPMHRLRLERAQLEIDALRNPRQQSLINAGDGRLFDPNSREWIVSPDAEQPKVPDAHQNLLLRAEAAGLVPGTEEHRRFMLHNGQVPDAGQFRMATPDEAASYGAVAGQFGPDGRFYPINPPSGMSIESDGQGGFRIVQGPGVTGGKSLTEGQSKDVAYATRAEGALATLDQFDAALTSPLERAIEHDPTGVIRGTQSPEFQQAQQAGLEFLQAILRKDTGAAITKAEQEEYGRVYLPMPGDSTEVLEQKRISRRRALEAIKAGMPPQAILNQERALERNGKSDDEWQDLAPGVRIRRAN